MHPISSSGLNAPATPDHHQERHRLGEQLLGSDAGPLLPNSADRDQDLGTGQSACPVGDTLELTAATRAQASEERLYLLPLRCNDRELGAGAQEIKPSVITPEVSDHGLGA